MLSIPNTRSTDPETSRMAAAKVAPSIETIRGRVSIILAKHPKGLTHDQIIGQYRATSAREGWPMAGDSTIRTRVSELVRDGEAERVPDVVATSKFGRVQHLWRALSVHVA